MSSPYAQPAGDRLGAYLIAAGKLSAANFDRAQRVQGESGQRIEFVLTQLGLASEGEVTEALADLLKLPLVRLADFPSETPCELQISQQFLRQLRALPIEDRPGEIVLAMANPLDDDAVEAIRFAFEKPVRRCVAYPADIDAAFDRWYGSGSKLEQITDQASSIGVDSTNDDLERLRDLASEAPVIRLVNLLITRAVEARASDIHIEPMDGELRIRYRIDGVLQEVEAPPQTLAAAVTSRVKIMAKLNIAERRLAQDGRIRIAIRGKDIDFRISTTPTIHGESVVLRILDRSSVNLDFAELGFDEDVLHIYRQAVGRPHGIVLVTGPTGSGKTTTLYASLLELNSPEKKILTIEDPVEYQLKGINQVQVKPQIGLTFANALRSFLRQDPDIMMIGEIRDLETAQIAIQAALTGHLILSTLHTNSAATAVTRLLDMGVEDYLLTSTVNALIAQRLLRTLCLHCREPHRPPRDLVDRLNLSSGDQAEVTLYRAVGCLHCGGSGYRGRTSIVEVMSMTDSIRQLVLRKAEAGSIQKCAVEEGMDTMYQRGLMKAVSGVTTLEEVFRVTRER